ncbi:nucleotidyltransferase domain-containing protein [archaeon]|nr:nucleotidyltransferase domain-containing protein [archaeon]
MNEEKVAYDLAIKIYKKFQQVVKSIVFFGSAAKDNIKKHNDIDIIIIVDDCTIDWDDELIAWYREELAKILAKDPHKDKLHINTVTLSTFWDEFKNGEPVTINIVRYGKSLIDFGGFFEPLKILLAKGKVKPSAEAIYNALQRAPYHLSRSKYGIYLALDSLYWAMVDSSQAAIMMTGEVPPSPEHIPQMLRRLFVKNGKLKPRFIEWYKEMYGIIHHLSKGAMLNIPGKKIQDYQKRADTFVGEMAKIVRNLE